MSADFFERIAEHRRLCILRTLAEDPIGCLRRELLGLLVAAGGAANLSLLTDGLRDLGYEVTRDQVHAVAGWCVAQGLAVPQPLADIPGWHISEPGAEVVEGHASTPGVAPPPTSDELVRRLSGLAVKVDGGQVMADCEWLFDHHLVTRTRRLTRHGADVAAGRITVAGVKKPSYTAMLAAAVNVSTSILGG